MAATRPQSSSGFPDPTPINLTRLLSRLEHTVLVEPSQQLRKSPYERARISANIEHARTLLLSLEHSASTLPSKSKKSALQADLQQKRKTIKQLNQRIYELNQLDDTESEASVDSDDEDEDQFPSYAPRIMTQDGIDITSKEGEGNEALQNAARNLTSQMRRRGQAQEAGGAQAASGNSLHPSKATTTTGNPSLSQTEALLSHDRNEQEKLTESLLEMAKQLKAQSVHFGNTLDSDKGVVDRAVSGLDKNQINMDAASQRMGTLRRMTEGKGWWDRMKLYAMIGGLWLIAFLIVFVGPKIRF
ncbi:synaptobrevin [Didymella exigua CBS 183.55]|uniref:Synaptobrevin n=1 Tax=Didymella exigua CBS 183.55 TaxID=1150837 RepID=A0A6A5RIY1_9PLEO|nr:synaptobrevin [Didymella exigua CBS 183.55]KAF1927772.1 synaptobrevin [Didymella exigua CBS 183.55]